MNQFSNSCVLDRVSKLASLAQALITLGSPSTQSTRLRNMSAITFFGLMRNVERFLQSLVVGRDLAVQLNDVGKDVWERAKVIPAVPIFLSWRLRLRSSRSPPQYDWVIESCASDKMRRQYSSSDWNIQVQALTIISSQLRLSMLDVINKTLEVVDVRVDAIPPYAILSHTWGDEEVTFHDLQHVRGHTSESLDDRGRAISKKEGFLKVKDAAALAITRGHPYIWVDTCCIDKSSSAELSEAINSMYLWYQKSEECYAFLSDVKSVEEEDWSAPDSSLRRSRWFTRGWTLQELIAPKVVYFYDKYWTLLGRKDGQTPFSKIIREVTGIDREVLDRKIDPLQLSISARMKWASHRQTTRLEDTAYCLMGLFQVNMPLLYGEGNRAFTRLQEEIIQRSDDQSLYAWNSFDTAEEDPDALSGLLAVSPAQFKNTGKIQPLPPSPVYPSAPSAMTSHGLRVQLYLRPILEADGVPMEEDFYAILDCFVLVGDLYLCPVLRMRRLSQDQYARLQTKSRKLLPALQAELPEYEGYRTIYVRQQPFYYHLPQFRVSPLHVASEDPDEGRHHYELVETFPHRQWNSATMTMEVKYSRKLQAMGVFRFQGPSSLEKKITELRRIRSSAISSGTLREKLGDDSRLMTDATVEGVQLQGRLYISISISMKPEIHTMAEGLPLKAKETITSEPQPRRSRFPDSQVQALTSLCSYDYTIDSFRAAGASDTEAVAVRGRPPSSSNLRIGVEAFMEPLLTFIRLIRDRKANPDLFSTTFAEDLALAVFEGNESELDRLLKTGGYIDAYTSDVYGLGPLHWAVVGGSIDCIRILLRKGVSPLSVTREGYTALHISAALKRSVWKALKAHDSSSEALDELANHRTKDHLETALHLAATYCSTSEEGMTFFNGLWNDLVEHASLLARNKYDETPLHRAAAFNNVGVIEAIVYLARDDIIDVVDQYGRSPLWHAAATGSCDAIAKLIALGATIDLTDDMGRSPLHAASRGGYDEAVEALLHEGARSTTATSMLGLTALDYAAMFGHVKCLQHLLYLSYPIHSLSFSQDAVLDPQNHALSIAASCGWLKCVEFLCQSGAYPYISTGYYFKLNESKTCAFVVEEEGTAASAADKEGHEEIVHYFNFSEACKGQRQKLSSGINSEGEQHEIRYGGLSPVTSHATATSPITDTHDSVYSQDPPTFAPPNSLSRPDSLMPGSGHSSALPQHYQSIESYRDVDVSATIPYSSRGSIIGSHSATVPAFSIQAYPRAAAEPIDTPQYPQYQPPPQSSHPRLSSSQTPSGYSRQGGRESLQSEYHDVQIPGPPLSYPLASGRPISVPYLPPGDDRRLPAPYPALPTTYSSSRIPLTQTSQQLAPQSSLPLSVLPSSHIQEDHQQPPSQPTTVHEHMVRMLGFLGHGDFPSDPSLVHHDTYLNGPVSQYRDPENHEQAYPIHELPPTEAPSRKEVEQAILSNLARMLGWYGTMLAGTIPTDPLLLHYEPAIQHEVYQTRDSEGSAAVDGAGYPIFEIDAGLSYGEKIMRDHEFWVKKMKMKGGYRFDFKDLHTSLTLGIPGSRATLTAPSFMEYIMPERMFLLMGKTDERKGTQM
ncbi:hypothetical protein BKA65DRAFT_475049 [Rhexocercosporidium sp. MPI-PUGE-AT-0058]|nr:hypothetical protein BKA65DRAFT_475049 [Rhexocercosporidium sp. MPI-PUGE-AT-0058]